MLASLLFASLLQASLAPAGRSVVLTATIVDESLRPVPNCDFWARWHCWDRGGNEVRRIATDGEGRLAFPLPFAYGKGDACELRLERVLVDAPHGGVGEPFAYRLLDEPSAPGSHELGEVVIAPFGSVARFQLTSDGELERLFRGGIVRRVHPAGEFHEEFLGAIVQRAGTSWHAVVADELRLLRAATDERPRGIVIGELELLMALRLIEGSTPPCTLELLPRSVLAPKRGDSPIAELALRNADARSEAFDVGFAVSPPEPSRFSVEAIGPDGTRCEELEFQEPAQFGATARGERLYPGGVKSFRIALRSFLRFNAPGVYRVRIHYHDKCRIRGLESLAGRFVTSSSQFTVTIAE